MTEKPSHLFAKNAKSRLMGQPRPLDKLAIIADKVSEVVGSSSNYLCCPQLFLHHPSHLHAVFSQPWTSRTGRSKSCSCQVAELTRERNSSRHQRYSSDRRRSHSRSRSVNRGSGICYYHRRYKEQWPRECVALLDLQSPWSSSLFMLCPNLTLQLDLLGITGANSVTEFDGYPMPYLNDFAHALHGKEDIFQNRHFKAFHQIPIAECGIPKTAA
ncbi:hypothetical protein TNCV_4548051 [Trichonephila clavipes]|nr:hypothetical protein TNCV_4548051 [Trichonephila clavipes]